MIPPEPGPDPTPDPDPPTPTGYEVAVTMNNTTSMVGTTTWLQSGDTWGSGIVGSTSTKNGTATFSNVPAGDYYIYIAPTSGTVMSNYRKNVVWNGSGVTTTAVTNGTLNAWKSSNKVTVSGASTLTVTIQND